MLAGLLQEQHQFRTNQLAELSGQLQLAPTEGEDAQRAIAMKLAAAAQRALTDIEAALARLGEGSYGHCVTCRERIPLERLEVLPQSAHCLSCQQ